MTSTLRLLRPVGFRKNDVFLLLPRVLSTIWYSIWFGSFLVSVHLPEPTILLVEAYSKPAPTPVSGPKNFHSMRGSRSASVFHSLKRRGLVSVSRTMIILRFVSMLSDTWREDGSAMPTTT